ncbi:tyrosine-type recombinase/integrase [Rhizobium leguminosarum]|nr:tyrosine-type recombinase/integrase [Rhizobium leguminosarum]UIK09066.1 tyrosine-type recombinase/integrase [Rhizobium leguminosarum]
MASVRRQVSTTGTTYFQAVWSLTGKDGTTKRQTKSFSRQADAKAYAAKMEAECEKRGIGDAEKQTFVVFTERLMAHWQARGELAETSLIGYRRNLGLLAREIGHIPLGKLSPLHIDEALAALKANGGAARKPPKAGQPRGTRPLADRTLLHLYRIGSTAMEQARRWKLIASNPFKDVKAPSPGKSKIKIMTEEEAIRVYQAATRADESGKHPGMALLVALLMVCGMRRSEILGLSFDAIDLDSETISVFRTVVAGEKGEAVLRDERAKSESSIRTITIPSEVISMIRNHRIWINEMVLQWGKGYQREPLLLFPTFGGAALPPRVLTSRLRQLHRRAGVKGIAPTHGFRHGMASAMVANGIDIKTVSERLGHSTTGFTLATYVHAVKGRDKAAADQLGKQFSAIAAASGRP